LTPEEVMQIWSYYSLGFHAASQAYADYKQGIISAQRWHYSADIYINMINHPVGLAYWNTSKDGYLGPLMDEFVVALQSRIDAMPRDLTRDQFRAVVDAVQGMGAQPEPPPMERPRASPSK
jgi:hypothetical protein